MRDASAPAEEQGTRGPHDDFYCQKYQVWYRLDDCVYRGLNRTYAGCVDCAQGKMNIRAAGRSAERRAGANPAGLRLLDPLS
ncbi:MAG TPA: hypothetical protein VJV23_00500 [Candidatus Polarisedimenticolia bacterium]|nr:hypothetical protein [Candidatus Polarisedimenticolia bacterium]